MADPVNGSDDPPVPDLVAVGETLPDSPATALAPTVVLVFAPLTDCAVDVVSSLTTRPDVVVVVALLTRIIVVVVSWGFLVVVAAVPQVTDNILCTCCGPWKVHRKLELAVKR